MNYLVQIRTKVRFGVRIVPHANSCYVYKRQNLIAGCVQSNLIRRQEIQKKILNITGGGFDIADYVPFVFYSTDKINQSPVIRKSNREISLQKLMFWMTLRV